MTIEHCLVVAVIALFALFVKGYDDCKKERKEFLDRLLKVEQATCGVRNCSLRKPLDTNKPTDPPGIPVTV